jgi:hypothetical protein
MLGSQEQQNVNQEFFAVGVAVQVAAEQAINNPDQALSLVQSAGDKIADNSSVRSISHVVGRAVTGIIFAPVGIVAAIGDVTKEMENGVTSISELLESVVMGTQE